MQCLFNSFRMLSFCIVAVAVFLTWTPTEAQDSSPAPFRYDIADVVQDIATKLSQGSDAAQRELEGLDSATRDALNRMVSGQDFRYVGFSARTKIEALYNLAEAYQPGEGYRFLAKLHRRTARNSGAVDLDPGLQAISHRFTPEELTRDLGFADPRELGDTGLMRVLPTDVEGAVDLLCRAVAPEEFSTVVDLVERNFRLGDSGRQIINRAIMQGRNRRDALGLMIRAHGPPPPLQEATRGLLMDVAADSAAFAMDEGVLRTLRELAEEPLPSPMRSYLEVSDELPSRIAQSEAAPGGMPISRPLTQAAASTATRAILGARGVEGVSGQTSDSGGPSYGDTRRAHAAYSRRVHSGTNGVPRAYSRAIRSSRAARGIAVGGQVEFPSIRAERAFWLSSRDHPDFGRIAVKQMGRDRLVASRYLFADSFETAVALLWEDHGREAVFRDGEVVILVSMDPDSSIGSTQRAEVLADVERRIQELAAAANSQTEFSRALEFYGQAVELQAEIAARLSDIPRGIVVHPALHGRELAWSGVRVDFWFNDLDQVSEEGARLNGGRPMPRQAAEAFTGSADTWQFYERDSRITIDSTSGPADSLRVRSHASDSRQEFTAENHFSVSLFSFGETAPSSRAVRESEEGVRRLVGEERAVQPMLDWAFANHHDFIRLNDFSAALSILRWLDQSGRQLVLLDPDGAPAKIATPDRVYIGTVGPHAGERR
jgi:hypothetical protein